MIDDFSVTAASGTLRSSVCADVELPHTWSDEGVAIETQFTGAHLLHLATAACVLNDLYREAGESGVQLRGVRVRAAGTFDTETWRSNGITYRVDIDSPSPPEDVDRLLEAVDRVAEIPRVLRAGAQVQREQHVPLPGARPGWCPESDGGAQAGGNEEEHADAEDAEHARDREQPGGRQQGTAPVLRGGDGSE